MFKINLTKRREPAYNSDEPLKVGDIVIVLSNSKDCPHLIKIGTTCKIVEIPEFTDRLIKVEVEPENYSGTSKLLSDKFYQNMSITDVKKWVDV